MNNNNDILSLLIFNYETTELINVSVDLKSIFSFNAKGLRFENVFPNLDVEDIKKHLQNEKDFLAKVFLLEKEYDIVIEKVTLNRKLYLFATFLEETNIFVSNKHPLFFAPTLWLDENLIVKKTSKTFDETFKCCKDFIGNPFYRNFINSFDEEYINNIKESIKKFNFWYGTIRAESHKGQYSPYLAIIDPDLSFGLKPGYKVTYLPLSLINGEESTNNYYLKNSLLNIMKKKLLSNLNKKKYTIFIDYNNFKEINDKYGHLAGDQAIAELRDVIKKTFPNDYVARYGGDEFLVFIDRKITDDELIEKMIELEKEAQTTFSYKPTITKYLLSVGVSKYPSNGKTTNDLIYSADLAMYNAKRNNKSYELAYEKGDL